MPQPRPRSLARPTRVTRRGFALVAILAFSAGCSGGDGGGDGGGGNVSLGGIQSLTLSPLRAAVGLGESERFQVTGHYEDGTTKDVSGTVVWSIATGVDLATIDDTGLATGRALGTATVLARQPATGLEAAGFLEVERFGHEGHQDEPLPLALETPHAGHVNTGKSYYVFDVTPGRYYYVYVEDPTDRVDYAAYDDAGRTALLCEGESPLDDYCVTRAAVSGEHLYVDVDGTWTDTFFGGEGGAEYGLRVVPGYVDEGRDTPVSLTVGTAHQGMVGLYMSRYTVPVTSGAEYRVSLAGATDHVSLTVDARNYDPAGCPTNPDASDQTCLVRPDGDVMEIDVYGTTTTVGAGYSLQIEETAPPFVADGSVDAPVDLTGAGPWDGQVDSGDSYYAYPVVPGKSYRVRVENASRPIAVYVSDGDGTFATHDCYAGTDGWGDAPPVCEITPATTDTLFVRVHCSMDALGTTYRIFVDEIGYAPEGVDAPLALDAPPVQHDGQVDGTTSRYVVPVEAGAQYEVAIRNLVNDADLRVYGDAAETVLLCASETAGRADEVCLTNPRPSGDRIWIVVDGGPGVYGGTYTLGVNRLYESAGTETAPADVGLGTTHAYVGPDAWTYYRVPVDAGRAYQVQIGGNTDDVYVQLHESPSDFSVTGRCPMWAPGSCVMRPVTTGSLYVFVSSSYTSYGAEFDLTVTPVPYTAEGTASAPVDLGAQPVEHDGETDGTSSHYRVAVDPGVPYDVRLKGPAVTADLRVYADGAQGTELCTSANVGVADEACLVTAPTGTLHIVADGSASGFGSVYTLAVGRHYTSEGSIPARPKDPGPVVLTVGTPHDGEVVGGRSFYQAAVTQGASYTVTVSNLDNPAYLYVYDGDATFTTPRASDTSSGTGDKTVTLTAGADVLYFTVVSTGDVGSAYTVVVQPG